MEFDIDVSGEDLLSKNYTICIANKDSLIRGFKFNEELISILCARYGQGLYKYKKTKGKEPIFKVRLYSIILYYLFKSLKLKDTLSLNICRDFYGNEEKIKDNLRYFLGSLLELNINEKVSFIKLDKNSNAHHYAGLMRKDNKNLMREYYVKITIEDIESFLK
ncbi:MAG: hypothetical protein Q8L27_03280 [archaeon]|nr:hypothetical protein [archaeon]